MSRQTKAMWLKPRSWNSVLVNCVLPNSVPAMARWYASTGPAERRSPTLSAHGNPNPSGPALRGHLQGGDVDVPAPVRRPRPGHPAGHGDGYARQLVVVLRQLAGRPQARRARLRPVCQPGPQGARRTAVARPDARLGAGRQPVRLLPALQGV